MSRVSAWPRPAAVLLDFGGVLVESRRRPAGVAELAIQVSAMLATRDVPAPDVSTIDSDIAAGLDAWRRWKTARSRESAPRELSHQEFWARFVAASWSEPARRVVVDAAFELCRSLVDRTAIRSPKPGASEASPALGVAPPWPKAIMCSERIAAPAEVPPTVTPRALRRRMALATGVPPRIVLS